MKEKPVKKKKKTSHGDFFDMSSKPVIVDDDLPVLADDDFEDFSKEPEYESPIKIKEQPKVVSPPQIPISKKKSASPIKVIQREKSITPPPLDIQIIDPPEVDPGQKIRIKIEFEKGSNIKYVVFSNLTFETLYIEVAKKLKTLPTKCHIRVNGVKISPYSVPSELDIADGAVVQCDIQKRTRKKVQKDKEELIALAIEFPTRTLPRQSVLISMKNKFDGVFNQLDKLLGPVILEYQKTQVYRFTLPSSIGVTANSVLQCYSLREYEKVLTERSKALASLEEPEEVEQEEEQVKMNIKICFKQEKLNIKATNETLVGEMVTKIQKKFQIKHLYFDGDLLEEDSTLESLGIEDGDQLEAK
ncbi:hypothetical protein HDV01_001457 [Terramyces sp. JEL0728]|nr:hypothetical protein HDV01_001457 [Terramyces sp. JEL0728]